MPKKTKLLSYDDLLAKNPNQTIWRTNDYFRENSHEATELSRKSRLEEIGQVIKFIQDHGLTRRTLCETAPDIPEDFFVYLRDITPECLDFYRTGYMKWLRKFERDAHADPSDVRIMEKALAEMRHKANLPTPVDLASVSAKKSSGKPRAQAKASTPVVKYDDVTWHSEGDFPTDLPEEAGATHIGMFVAWLLLHDLASSDHAEAFSEQQKQLRNRQITPGAYLLQVCDGKFVSDDFNETGNAFARDYYDMQSGNYIADYEKYLASDLPTAYHVQDSWENYDKLMPVVEKRYAAWCA